ncbi:MAG: epoxyqueuosine reductase QueH [Nitrospirae bacterium]|nr:epoxyqueuosine reductase QueH [Nitrospirota bacterium]
MNILLHICCSNCAIYPVQRLSEQGHNFKGFWFNPNIHSFHEYMLRLNSLKDLADKWDMDVLYREGYGLKIKVKVGTTRNRERCQHCYRLRLEETAKEASKGGFDAFTTTLLVSPYQEFEKIAVIGNELSEQYNVLFYLEDFRPGFRGAMALSKELGLYRQKYCGCIYSEMERHIKAVDNVRAGLALPNNK